jgi:hypothetical protein
MDVPARMPAPPRWPELLDAGTQTGPLVTEGGTLPASGNAFAFPYVDQFQLRDGICVSHRIYWGNLGFMMQLGITP